MKQYVTTNDAVFNSWLASGKFVRVGNSLRFFTSPKCPGLLLVKLDSQFDFLKCSGVAGFYGGMSTTKVEVCVNAHDVRSALNSLVTAMDDLRLSDLIPEGTDYKTYVYGAYYSTPTGYYGNVTKSEISSYALAPVVGPKVDLYMGVITGASYGRLSCHLIPSTVTSFGVLSGNGSGDCSISAETGNSIISTLDVGAVSTFGSMVQRHRAVLVDGMPSEAIPKANDLIDEWLATHWLMPKVVCIGESVRFTASEGGAISVNDVGVFEDTQFKGIPYTGRRWIRDSDLLPGLGPSDTPYNVEVGWNLVLMPPAYNRRLSANATSVRSSGLSAEIRKSVLLANGFQSVIAENATQDIPVAEEPFAPVATDPMLQMAEIKTEISRKKLLSQAADDRNAASVSGQLYLSMQAAYVYAEIAIGLLDLKLQSSFE